MASKLPVVEVVEPPADASGSIVLARDCEATRIPSGASAVLPAGTRVTITQTLGGHFTVTTEDGALLRIADKDADALGEAAAASAPMVEGPFEEERVWEQLRTVFDPEIPVNVHDLGLIYDVIVDANAVVGVVMTLTAPACPAAQWLPGQVEQAVKGVEGVTGALVDVVFDPPWSKDRMSEAAKLQLGLW